MVSSARPNRAVSPNLLPIALVIAVAEAGVVVYRPLLSASHRPTGVEQVEPLPEGQLAPPKGPAFASQAGRPRDYSQR